MTTPPPKPAKRRALPQARPNDARYEIVFPKRSPAASVIAGLFAVFREGFDRGGEAVGDAYASAARVVLERKERLEDLNAERRRPRPAKALAIADARSAPSEQSRS